MRVSTPIMRIAENSDPAPEPPGWFTTTHWTVVLNAKADDSTLAAQALGKLCENYWKPVNAYVRQRGHAPADADDLTQQFFARFLEKEHYRLAKRERGRFRTFLLTSVKRFLINEWERASAQKRGGGRAQVSLDETALDEDRPRVEPADEATAEQAYERNWAMTLLERVRDRLVTEYAVSGAADRFAQLEKFLPGEEADLTYAQAATRFGVAEGTIKSDVHRLKKRYREVLREELGNTVSAPGEIEDELRHLMAICARGS